MITKDSDELIKKTILWLRHAEDVIAEAGGHPSFVIDMFPPALLEILIRNDLYLTYNPRPI